MSGVRLLLGAVNVDGIAAPTCASVPNFGPMLQSRIVCSRRRPQAPDEFPGRSGDVRIDHAHWHAAAQISDIMGTRVDLRMICFLSIVGTLGRGRGDESKQHVIDFLTFFGVPGEG